MTTFFTADTHFGHDNIIKHSSRPFGSVAEMDAAMIANWNAVVQEGDTVWHLGDFAFDAKGDRLKAIFDKLNGDKHLVVGNHDKAKTLGLKWKSVHHMHNLTIDGTHVVVCHYGMRVWPRSHKGSLHLYGHSHGTLPGWRQSCDVGVDEWNFRPVTLDAIKMRLANLPNELPPVGLDHMGDEAIDVPDDSFGITI